MPWSNNPMQESHPLLDERYQVIKQLGEGAFARTYLVEDTHIERPDFLVVKQFKEPTSRTQAINEFEALLKLFNPRHPDPACQHLPWIHEVHLVAHDAHVIMDYIPGPTLEEVASEFPWPIEDWWSFAQSLLSVLTLLEKHHLLHRDIKPGNIILQNGERRQPVLIDFGFATSRSVTITGAGTAGYLPPEAGWSPQPPESSDRYGLSMVLFQVLTGQEPVSKPATDGYTRIVCMPPLVDEKVLPLAEVLLTAIATDPAERPGSASDLRGQLEEVGEKYKLLSPHQSSSPRMHFPPPSPVRQKDSPGGSPDREVSMSAAIKAMRRQRAHSPPPAISQEIRRQRMLEKVQNFWIKNILEKPLHGADLIVPGLSEQPEVVANPLQLLLQQENQAANLLPPGTDITQVYDSANRELLILGEPGSGKTTLLLALTRDLLKRAQKDTAHQIPVVFNLSSWAVKRQPLIQWLIEELNEKYKVHRDIGEFWVYNDQILPLLDGLDEVALDSREACIDAINDYIRAHGLMVPMVVCSRGTDYMKQTKRLQLQSAVVVQPLTEAQIEAYLTSAGEKLAGLRQAIDEDEELLELATTPLMLSIMILAYSGVSAGKVTVTGSLTTRKQQILATYVQRMLSTRRPGPHYTEKQSLHWLTWLARLLIKEKEQTEFYLERMQLDSCFVKSRPAEIYTSLAFALLSFPFAAIVYGLEYSIYGVKFALVNGTLAGLTTGLIAFFFVWFIETDIHMGKLSPEVSGRGEPIEERKNRSKLATFLAQFPAERVGFALLSGLLQGIVVEFLVGPFYSLINGVFIAAFLVVLGRFKKEIRPAETLIWSWKSVRKHAWESFLQGFAIGVLGGVFNALPYLQHVSVFLATLYFWLSLGAALGIIIMVMRGFSGDRQLDPKQIIKPNQGIRNSLSNSLRLGLSSGLLLGLVVFFFYSYVIHNVFVVGYVNELPTNVYVIYGVGDAVAVAYLFWLINGGFATVQHFVLRILLWTTGCTPWRYPQFLDYAHERILLRKIGGGGGYIFMHRLLRDYFANPGIKEEETQFDGQ
ncbi:MAG TPA: NACHT domain-containing protein [Ktedonobacteraceae bacterium]|nr:NACHT domain-containing protein [Ktedonobacteraceae bacterium]